jgi:hypothetical protein
MMKSGPIRFVGGPWHNRIIHVNWMPVITAPIYPTIHMDLWKMDSAPLSITLVDYRLTDVRIGYSRRGAVKFYEYHFTEMDPNQAVSSGHDGAVTNWRVPTR